MAGNVSHQGIIAPQAAPVGTETIEQILEDYPELAPEIAACTGWRDVSNQDRRSKGFERKFPNLKPKLSGEW